MIHRRFVAVKRSGSTRSALSGSRANCSITSSISSALRTSAANGFIDNNGAAASTALAYKRGAVFGLKRYATRVMFGAIPFDNSSHLLAIDGAKFVKPVRLPPVRARLCTTRGDRVADLYNNRGRRACGFPDRGSDGRRIGQDHIRTQVEHLFGELARARYIAATPAVDELDIAAL